MTMPETPEELLRARIEAILFATDQPVSARRIAETLRTTEATVRRCVEELATHYDEDGRAFTVEELAGGFQVLTRSEYGSIVRDFGKIDRKYRLSQAALETLAIVAYKQPIVRAEVDDIRGVQSSEVLRNLVEMGLVRIVARAETLGRPMLYGTTRKFLLTFGLKSARDLPPIEELKKRQ
jgi:segregation and condensation protein B